MIFDTTPAISDDGKNAKEKKVEWLTNDHCTELCQ